MEESESTLEDLSEENQVSSDPSIRNIWRISFPLMISTLAFLLMIFVDRMFLSHYSLEALNASVNAGTWAWAFMCGVGMLTAMSEVFVSQYNGAKKYHLIGKPVWQMVWIAFLSYLFFIPLSIWGGDILYYGSPYEHLEKTYFQILSLFAPCYALNTALSGFFVGRGKTRILIWLAIGANILNIGLDWMLIFGVEGLIAPMGVKGAAIATSMGYIFEVLVLWYIFLKRENRDKYQTHLYHLDRKEFTKCFRIGFPQAIFTTLEIVGFAIFYRMMTTLGEMHITISGVCQSILILLSFFFDGLSKGVAAVAGNFIGARKFDKIKQVLRSGVLLQLAFSTAVLLFFLFDLKFIFTSLFPSITEGRSPEEFARLYKSLTLCLYATYFYITFEGIRWVLSGILTAAGDTYFLLLAGTLSVWLFLLVPIYFIVVKPGLSVEIAWSLTAIYSGLSCIVYWIRLQKGAWQEKDLLN